MDDIHKALEILGLPVFITKGDIKRRYLYLAKKFHPDRGGDTNKMEEINWAYEVLNSYIDGFRYSFDEDEIKKQFPNGNFQKNFAPFGSFRDKKKSKKG
jgi:DnaJ-class molecular chaperone